MMNAGADSTPGVNDPGPDGADSEAPEAAAPEPSAPEPKPESVKIEPPKKSRREAFSASQDQLRAQIDELGKKASKADDLEKSVAEMRERLAKGEGAMEELRRQSTDARAPKQAESYDARIADLQQKTLDALLEKKDWGAYQRLQLEMAQTVAEKIFADQQKAAPRPVHPAIPALEMEFHEVAGHPAGRAAAVAFDNFLGAKGEADGPSRWRKAYEMAARELGYSKAAAEPSDKKKESLAGIAGSKGGGGKSSSAGRHVKLSQKQLEIAKKSGIGVEEYARLWADTHPEDVADD